MPRFRFSKRRVIIIGTLVLMVAAAATIWRQWVESANRAMAKREEVSVRRLLDDVPLKNLTLRTRGRAFSLLLGPTEETLMRINPIDPKNGLTKAVGPTIDACRKESGGVPAELILRRRVPISDPSELGQFSARFMGEVGMLKDIEFFTYGYLDVGIKDGAIVVVRVR